MKTAKDFFTQKNGGKTAEELLSEGVLISPILAVRLMEQYHESRMKDELMNFQKWYYENLYGLEMESSEEDIINNYLATHKNK